MKLDRNKTYIAMVRKGILTQKELCKKAKIGVSTLCIAMNGKNTSPVTVTKIALVLGVDPIEIIQTEGD